MTLRLAPADRKKEILAAAVSQARQVGYQSITREGIAAEAKCSTGLVTRYFTTMTQLKRSVMRAAVKDGEVAIVAQGLAANDPQAKKATDALKQKAAALIAS